MKILKAPTHVSDILKQIMYLRLKHCTQYSKVIHNIRKYIKELQICQVKSKSCRDRKEVTRGGELVQPVPKILRPISIQEENSLRWDN